MASEHGGIAIASPVYAELLTRTNFLVKSDLFQATNVQPPAWVPQDETGVNCSKSMWH